MIGTANKFPRTSNISLTINSLTCFWLNENQGFFARFGAKLWNSICDELRQLLKTAFKTHISDMLLSLLEAEDNYDQVSIPLQKIANYKV